MGDDKQQGYSKLLVGQEPKLRALWEPPTTGVVEQARELEERIKRQLMDSESTFDPVNDLIRKRDSAYAQAWRVTGECLKDFLPMLQRDAWDHRFTFNWIMILNKLHRALATPHDLDHWRDIEGYARLIIETLEADSGGDNAETS